MVAAALSELAAAIVYRVAELDSNGLYKTNYFIKRNYSSLWPLHELQSKLYFRLETSAPL